MAVKPEQSQPSTQSKNMLNSFRNGPVKIISGHHLGIQNSATAGLSLKTRCTTSKALGSSNQQTNVSTSRPSSAPQKRPASPSGNGQKELTGSA